MLNLITCPSCHHQFQPTDAFRDEVQKELNSKAREWMAKKQEEYNQRESLLIQKLESKDKEIAIKLNEEKEKLQQQLSESIRMSVSSDFENQLKLAKKAAADSEEKLKLARTREMEFLQKEEALKLKEEEMELTVKRKMAEERERFAADIRKLEEQKSQSKETEYQLRIAEFEKRMKDQEKLIEEMQRKAQQGSMQLQGEVQELMLEDILRSIFPSDKIVSVSKGAVGADCMQVICNPYGQECGKIIYESKRTKEFKEEWVDKLKADMRSKSADIAVIVTKALPRDMQRFGEKNGVYICTFAEVKSLAAILRTSILKVFALMKHQENKGDKMHMLYHYLTSNEFSEQWKAIREGFLTMKMSIDKERSAMEKLWQAREKQLEKILLNADHIKGSIEGIGGADSIDFNLLEDFKDLGLVE